MAAPRKAAKATKKAEPFFRPFSKIAKAKAEAPAGAIDKVAPKRPAPKVAPALAPPEQSDADAFARYMAGVRALEGDGATRIPRTSSRVDRQASPVVAPDAPDLDANARARLRELVSEGVRFETTDDGERLEGRRLDVDPRELRRLRRGQFALDARLDLHGMAVADARLAVDAFVKKHAVAGDRAVVVVHGKGSHSPRGVGALRGEIAAWLSQGRAARHVRAFVTASEDAGGAGALWVLLAR